MTVDGAESFLHVEDRITLRAAGAVSLRLARGLSIHSLKVDGRPARAEAAFGRWQVRLGPSGRHVIEIAYAGRFRPAASNGEGHAPVIGAEGGYLPGWTPWLPAVDGDEMTYRLTVRVREPQKAVATGDLVEEGNRDGWYHAVFAGTQAGEAPSLFTGPYSVVSRPHPELLLRAYVHPGLESVAAGYLTLSEEMISHFEEAIGPYPFTAFHIVSAPLPVGLGFPGLTYIGRRVLPLPFIRSRSLAHEILHNWWGNGTWPASGQGNWAEGLTTLMADHDLTAARSPREARAMRLGWLRDYAALPPDRDAPVATFLGKSHDASQVVGYNKTALVFLMLRNEIGDEAFKSGLQSLWNKHRGQAASWHDLEVAFAESSRRDLAWFFEQWLAKPGAPRLILESAKTDANGLTLRLAQSRPSFKLTVPVAVTTALGTERHHLKLDTDVHAYRLRPAGRPLLVEVDPDYELFRRLSPGEAPPILRDVTLASHVDTVVLPFADRETSAAAGQLADRLLDAAVTTPPEAGRATGRPLLLIGPTDIVAVYLRDHRLPPVPEALAGTGNARAWAARAGDAPILVIAADDAEALRTIVRPLPHYVGEGWVAFADGRMIDKGQWPADNSALTATLR